MSDQAPDLDFEEPPPIARKSEHHPLLLALRDHPNHNVRIQRERALTAAEAASLAGSLTRAADKMGGGYEVTTRFIPAASRHGVWVKFVPSESVPSLEAAAEAKAIIDEAMTPDYRKAMLDRAAELARDAIPVTSAPVTADEEDIDPIGDDSEWELPERSGVTA